MLTIGFDPYQLVRAFEGLCPSEPDRAIGALFEDIE